jgi:hypothetical protein
MFNKSNQNKMDNIKTWYTSNYPDDTVGDEINNKAEFSELEHNLDNVYEYIGVHDSIIRERIFEELSCRLNKPYDDIYDKWLALG